MKKIQSIDELRIMIRGKVQQKINEETMGDIDSGFGDIWDEAVEVATISIENCLENHMKEVVSEFLTNYGPDGYYPIHPENVQQITRDISLKVQQKIDVQEISQKIMLSAFAKKPTR